MTTYGSAGVDLEGADRHVASIEPLVTATWGPNVVGGFGGFAAGIELPEGMRKPVLMLSTDGVGTKLEIARRLDSWEGVGFDLVAMCVDDLAAVGARSLGFVDYMAVGSLRPERDTAVVASIARACTEAGCALVGGETAEHPGVMEADAIDLAGAALGVVESGSEITGGEVEAGHLIVGLTSPNLRSNGFSLVRAIVDDWSEPFEGSTIGATVLEPSVIYAPSVLSAMATGAVTGAAHITGGGIPGNLKRPIPAGLTARVDARTWTRPAVFDHVADVGALDSEACLEAFNMGMGFALIVRAEGLDDVLEVVGQHDPFVAGEVIEGDGPISIVGIER